MLEKFRSVYTSEYSAKAADLGYTDYQILIMASIVEREAKIMNFKKEQYFMAHILCGGVDAVTERIDRKTEADRYDASDVSDGSVPSDRRNV